MNKRRMGLRLVLGLAIALLPVLPRTLLAAVASDSLVPAWVYAGTQTGQELGFVVNTAGDVNDDGYDDVIVGSRFYSAAGYSATGRAYVFHGSPGGLAATPDRIIEPPVLNTNGYFGNSVGTAGDVDGDGYDDVIVGMPNYEGGASAPSDEGAVYVWLGSATGLGANYAWMAEGNSQWAHLGQSSGTAGDVNGDGYDDIIVGASLTVQLNTASHAYVWYGSASGLGDPGMPANADWTGQAISTQAYTGFGSSVGTAGDVNGDGFDDIVVAAPFYDGAFTNEGAVFVWHGSASGLGNAGTLANADWKVYGDQAEARLGGYDPSGANSAGDVNGDGYDDLIAGAYGYDNPDSGEGRAYVWHGSPLGLSASADWVAEGNQAGAALGFMVSAAGDVNGDAYDDVVVSAHGYDTALSNAGAAFLWYGSALGLGEDGAPANADAIAAGDQVDGYHARAVGAAGDVNGDGLDDVIVGSPQVENPSADNSGRAYLYLGASPCRVRLNSDPTAFYNVQAAVDAGSAPGDVVKVAGTCTGVWVREGLTQTVYLSRTLTLRGGYTTTNWTTPDPVANPTTLDAQGLGRVLYVTGDNAPVIEGLVITGGNAWGLGGIGQFGDRDGGGGAYVLTSTATIQNCTFTGNSAEGGAAIALGNSSAEILSNVIAANLADNQGGGAIHLGGSGTPLIAGNAIHDNVSVGGGGGALACFYGAASLVGNALTDNTSDESGGALYLQGCDVTLHENTLVGNSALLGGGALYAQDSTLSAVNSLIGGNAVTDTAACGGGIELDGSVAHLVHTTLADNGGSTHAGVAVFHGSTAWLTNTIITQHGTGIAVEAGSAATLEATLWGTGATANDVDWDGAGAIVTGTINLWGPPAYLDAAGDDYHIGAGSAAIDAGVDAGVLIDIERTRRVFGPPDLGADEWCTRVFLPLALRNF